MKVKKLFFGDLLKVVLMVVPSILMIVIVHFHPNLNPGIPLLVIGLNFAAVQLSFIYQDYPNSKVGGLEKP